MRSQKVVFAVLFVSALMFLPAASAEAHGFHGGGVVVTGGWGGWGWGGWGWGYPGYGYYGYPAGYGYGGYGPAQQFGRVKTDVDPEEAWLYLDGRLIGTADDFDGYPDYLYLKRGHYRLEFRLDGYETLTVEIDAQPGMTAKIDTKMKKIPGSKHYGTYDQPKIEGGIQRFFGKRRDVTAPVDPRQGGPDSGGDGYSIAPGHDGDGDSEPPPQQWRQPPPPASSSSPSNPYPAKRTDKSHLSFVISPGDAAVYVDDRFVGTAEEVGSLAGGLSISSGKHTVTVSRPGFQDQSVDVEVEPGTIHKVQISLVH